MANAVIFIVFNKDKFSGKLTKFFTGSYAYHCGFYVPETDNMYDMNMLFRRLPNGKARYSSNQVVFIPCPVTITEDDLKAEIFSDVESFCDRNYVGSLYGFLDYIAFALKPAYHLFGKSTPNFDGQICSEKVNSLLVKAGWSSPFREVPSPADFVQYFNVQDPE